MEEVQFRVTKRVEETQDIFVELPFGLAPHDFECGPEFEWLTTFGDCVVVEFSDSVLREIAEKYKKDIPGVNDEHDWYADNNSVLQVSRHAGTDRLRGKLICPVSPHDFELDDENVDVEEY